MKLSDVSRIQLTEADINSVCGRLYKRASQHFEDYGAGIFVHPQEIVGCMHGQLRKLSESADACIYDEDTTNFEERCIKTALAMVMAIASVQKLKRTKTEVAPVVVIH